jgi:prefoldin subunit 5
MTTNPDPSHLSGRVDRLEEAATFADRQAEQLSAEIALLQRRLLELQTRLQGIEARLGSVGDAIERLSPPGGDTPTADSGQQ